MGPRKYNHEVIVSMHESGNTLSQISFETGISRDYIYSVLKKSGIPSLKKTWASPEERFWSFVDRGNLNGCWMWNGGKFGSGYGCFYDFKIRKQVQAHRWVFENIKNMEIPAGMEVCHSCDNPLCVNPDHLWVGTHRENMDDMFSKNRRREPSGEEKPNAKLTWKQVDEIRLIYSRGKIGAHRLAKMYGVSKPVIQGVIKGSLWRRI